LVMVKIWNKTPLQIISMRSLWKYHKEITEF
jgi:hypothetical protein